MNVRLFIGLLLVALLAPVAPIHAAGTLPNEDGIYEGFFGHPLLETEGWEAVGGKWDGLNLIGESVMKDLGNITDADPQNASSTGNLADVDLILGQTIVMRQKDTDNQTFMGGKSRIRHFHLRQRFFSTHGRRAENVCNLFL